MLKIMKDMLDVVKEKKEKHLEEIYEDTELVFVDEAENIMYVSCPEPRCDCGTLYLLHEIDNEKNVLPLNVYEDRILTAEEMQITISNHELRRKLTESFLEQANDELWAELTTTYLEKKNILIDEVNPSKITFEFDEKDILEEDLMMHFQDIFPCAHFPISLGQSTYVVTDTYCKSDLCTCKNMTFNIGKPIDGELEFIGYYEYDYGVQQGNFSDVEAENKLITQRVIDTLFLEYPDLNKTIRRRNTVVRKLFKKSKKKYWATQGRTEQNASRISRNAPCPCGSGKKYKRCCGRN